MDAPPFPAASQGNELMSVDTHVTTLSAAFDDYAHTLPLKRGEIASPRVAFTFSDIRPANRFFKPMVRELKFDVSEMAIATYVQAKAYGKPLVLVPATVMGRVQHGTILCNAARTLAPPAASRRADQPHGGGHGKARTVEPADSRGNLPAAAASQDRGRAAQGGRDRFSSLRPHGVPAGAADHHHLRAAAAAHSAKNRGR